MIVLKISSYLKSDSLRFFSLHKQIISRVPVPNRSIYPERYIGSASNGLAGNDPCDLRNFDNVL